MSFDLVYEEPSYISKAWGYVGKLFHLKQERRPSKCQIRFDFLIEDRKINLPIGYYLVKPLEFNCLMIDLNELEIGNKYGKIKWRCPKEMSKVNTQNINFSEGISIYEAGVSINKPELEIGCLIVTFTTIPETLQRYLSTASEKKY